VDGSLPLKALSPDGRIDLAPDAAPRQALQIIASACVEQIKANEAELARQRAPETLHQVRVAIRRWRSTLAILGAPLGEGCDGLKAELRWLAGELDEARDLDVLREALAKAGLDEASDGGRAALHAAMDRAKDRAYGRALGALQSERAQRLFWEGPSFGEDQAWPPSGQGPNARELVGAALDRWRRSLIRTGARLSKLDPAQRHQLRLMAKKARYAGELFGGLFRHARRQKRFIEASRTLQSALGELNDIHVGRALAQRLALEAGTPEAGFAAGLILGARSCQRKMLLKAADRAYDRFCEARVFW